jgi:hypothetical protein
VLSTTLHFPSVHFSEFFLYPSNRPLESRDLAKRDRVSGAQVPTAHQNGCRLPQNASNLVSGGHILTAGFYDYDRFCSITHRLGLSKGGSV